MIEINSLVVKYGEFIAVNGIDLQIEEGEFFTFLGPSGCGKTTTLRSIAGFERPADGSIIVDGVDLKSLEPEQRKIGFVFQNYALFPSMTVAQNIGYGLKVRKVNKAEIEERVKATAEKVGISEHLDKRISELSGGQQQRIAVARALVVEPKILLMDEPLSNLDAKLRISMRQEIKKLQKELKITTIYVTHDQEEALSISDRIAVFNVGKIDQIGTPIQVYENPETEFVARFIGDIMHLQGRLAQEIIDDLKIDSEVRLFVRPQNIHMLSHESVTKDMYLIRISVTGFDFLGASTKIQGVTSDGFALECQVFGRNPEIQVGHEILFGISKSDILKY
ncbi:MAG: ABC transporter ATP-binding protein [Sphaerochaetaceae bacterium]|nr:ABC transporter ATP-binding protein [Sphaerochaetaceae bacterium]